MTRRRPQRSLRRLRLHGLIERLPKTHRYRLTDEGLRTALFYTRVYSRLLRPAMAPRIPSPPSDSPADLRRFLHLLVDGIVQFRKDEAAAGGTRRRVAELWYDPLVKRSRA
jgi:hypothetical protein